jgi:hypothetical protein
MSWKEIALPAVAVVLASLMLGSAMGVLYLIHENASSDTILGQPKRERAQQRSLPQSSDPLWATLATTRIHEDVSAGLFSAKFPAGVSALNGTEITVSGFMLPLESKTATSHFLLSKRTPVCFFCPPGEPNEVIEVHSLDFIGSSPDLITVRGRFTLENASSQGLIFHLSNAVYQNG